MEVKDTYKPTSPAKEPLLEDDPIEKLTISNGAFALCTMMEKLINELRKTRTK